MFSHFTRVHRPTCTLGVLAATALLWAPLRIRREPIVPCGDESSASAWAEQLKGQTIIEDTMSGKGERAAMVEQQHQRIMEHMTHDPQVQASTPACTTPLP